MTDLYAQALYKAAHKEGANPKKLVHNLEAHLEREGKSKLLPGILREFQKLSAREEKMAPVIEISHANEKAGAVKEAAAHGITDAAVVVNHSLIKGWRATRKGTLVDHSAKRSLIELYRNIISPS